MVTPEVEFFWGGGGRQIEKVCQYFLKLNLIPYPTYLVLGLQSLQMMSYEPQNNRTLKVKIGQGVAAAPCLGIVKGLRNAEIIILDVLFTGI